MRRTLLVILSLSALSHAGRAQGSPGVSFIDFVTLRINGTSDGSADRKRITLGDICAIDKSPLARRVFIEYGAIFAAAERVQLPPTCMFLDEKSVRSFHERLDANIVHFGGVEIAQQKPAADSMLKLLEQAREFRIVIRPLDGAIGGDRTFADTVRLWNSRLDPALRYWVSRGRITAEEASQVWLMKLDRQVERIMEWESNGMWFGTSRTASIFSSTAPPGTSQHLSLLAFDVEPPVTREIRALFNSYGWYQTVKGDPPHFIFLGVPEPELPRRGLRQIVYGGTRYWVPNIIEVVPISSPSD